MEVAISASLVASPALGIPLIIVYHATMTNINEWVNVHQCPIASVLNGKSNECLKWLRIWNFFLFSIEKSIDITKFLLKQENYIDNEQKSKKIYFSLFFIL